MFSFVQITVGRVLKLLVIQVGLFETNRQSHFTGLQESQFVSCEEQCCSPGDRGRCYCDESIDESDPLNASFVVGHAGIGTLLKRETLIFPRNIGHTFQHGCHI